MLSTDFFNATRLLIMYQLLQLIWWFNYNDDGLFYKYLLKYVEKQQIIGGSIFTFYVFLYSFINVFN